MTKLNVGEIPIKTDKKEQPRPRKPDWYKATSEDISEYTALLDEHLNSLMYPESIFCTDVHCNDQQHRHDRDTLVLDILTSLVEVSHATIPLTKKARSKQSSSRMPGWDTHVEPFRQDAMFWHSVWLSADNPTRSALSTDVLVAEQVPLCCQETQEES